ncbi:hypothetical protein CVT24_005356 [Panaeolus cyanescens]|uniref:Conserved oligomeric Golgi complex subunit 1 n=1 Tax=Panaeolus cyanescens TaxID=181874 RepID=A0A409Y9B9_9AGAR|nr:hypothetical protein CVT24_005356 [Panaeolus cyanescens]
MSSILNSAASAASFFSPKSSPYPAPNTGQPLSAFTPSLQTASYLKSLPSAKFLNDSWNLNPDELFTKFTVAEVRNVQNRLQSDAEVKQEELRQMVGERYRDLLQASTSIISLAASSKRVLVAIEESKYAIQKRNDVPETPHRNGLSGVDTDRQLQAIQVLSVHVKLLLDAPEHLWRLIERRKYLAAAWLFLLSRVVHRALIRDEENDDDQAWCKEGIDVQVDFPLVQRQWDVVYQFRPQIIHKSTLALRDAKCSRDDICAILVTLHLLDSRPLHEALSTLLSQRSKTLDGSFNSSAKHGDPSQDISTSHSDFTLTIREVTQLMKRSLSTIIQTMTVAREIFEQKEGLPLLIRVLMTIQSESTSGDGKNQIDELPESLVLSTQKLLANLTSSANFQLLPESLRLYKPYVDLDSSSVKLSQGQLEKKLNGWLSDSSKRWKKSCQQWFLGLKSAKETWVVRGSLWRYISTSALVTSEKQQLLDILDSLAQDRIIDIWTNILTGAESQFRNTLMSITAQLEAKKLSETTSPSDILFQSPAIPVITHSTKHFSDAPFQKYQTSLKRQLVGRSAQLEEVLCSIEQCARVIQNDFLQLKGPGSSVSDSVVEKFNQIYQPKADRMTNAVGAAVEATVSSILGQASVRLHTMAFLSQLTDDLIASSTFADCIAGSPEVRQAFKLQIESNHERVTDKWSQDVIHCTLPESDDRVFSTSPREPNGPSTLLSRSLLQLCNHVQSLGVIFKPAKWGNIIRKLFGMFTTKWVERFEAKYPQTVFDLHFLHKIAELNNWTESSDLLQDALSACDPIVEIPDVIRYVDESIFRSQTLLCQFLPEPTGANVETLLLHLGTPSAQTHHNALDLARPSPRFGLLLAGNISHQLD